MQAPSHRTRAPLDMNLTSMIDVIFLLMIFFVCTASFQPPEELLPADVSVAGGGSGAAAERAPQQLQELAIELLGAGEAVRWQVQGRLLDSFAEFRRLLTELSAVSTGQPVVLDVEGPVAMARVVEAYDLCRELGFEQIQFAAELPATP